MARRAVINGAGQPLRFEDYEVPKTPSGHIRVKIAYSGVCHTDLHVRTDETDGPGVPTMQSLIGEEAFNKIVLGHEISGYVEDIASDVVDQKACFKKGDPVVVYPWLGCQKCSPCANGKMNNCIDEGWIFQSIGFNQLKGGGFQTHIVVDPKFVLKVPDSVPLDMACLLACSGGTAFSAVQKLREHVEFGAANSELSKARIMIIGAGGLGLWAVKLARIIYGDKVQIVVADVEQSKLDHAKLYGADEGVLWPRSSTEEEKVAAVKKTGQLHGAIDFVGLGATVSAAVKCLIRNGALVIVGAAGGILSLPVQLVISQQISVRGCIVMDMEQFKELISLVVKHNITYPDIKHYSLDEVNTVLEALQKGLVTGRAVLKQE